MSCDREVAGSRPLVKRLAILSVVSTLILAPSRGFAEEAIEYNRDVRPILTEHCFACHGADSAAREADLRLDLREAAVDYGAIVPGDPDQSSLVERIESDDPDMLMPPPHIKKELSPEQIDTLRRWVASGAEYQPHWSFVPPKRTTPPESGQSSWAKNPIDRFVLARMKEAGLEPAPAADARTLCRRLHLDITGLPPSPAAVDEFERDYAADEDGAVGRLVEKLMATPEWGEHRARYWLDAARYADTHGVHFDNYREIWPYRDWVIRAFNRNQPFDQFTIDQLAGDLREHPTEDQLIATGFQRCNPTTNEGGTIEAENLANYSFDRVQTFGWVFLGLTVNCAQCHDHKFDPISMRDYYSLSAYFQNTTAPALDGNVKDGRGPILNVPLEEDRPRWDALKVEIETAKKQIASRREEAKEAFEAWLATATPESLDDSLAADGLVLHLPLNEGAGGTIADSSTADNRVEVMGQFAWEAGGLQGAAPVFNGQQEVRIGGAGDFEKNQAFSVGAWVKTSEVNQAGGIIARMDVARSYRGWDLWFDQGAISVHVIDDWPGNARKVTTRERPIVANRWHHVMATYDGTPGGLKIYVDGKMMSYDKNVDNLRPEATIRTKVPMTVGRRFGGNELRQMSVQDARLYNRNLGPEEVEVLAKAPRLAEYMKRPQAERDEEGRRAALDAYLAVVDVDYRQANASLAKAEDEFETLRQRGAITHIQQERPNSEPMAYILLRGQYDNPGEQVRAGTPAALHAMPPDAPRNRLGLAQWVVAPTNPLTSRVTVNRFWQELFGQGLVATAEDFGASGELPSHPELLDWLAVEFMESGWDVQHMYHLMLTSATYRQQALATPEKLERDPPNRLLSRGPRFRMDGEMVRDYALAASGLLSPKRFGPGTRPYQPDHIWDIVGLPGGDTRNYVQDTGENLYRRSVYTFWKRMAPPPNLEAFNSPSREVCTVRRERTNTPLQALVTLNDPQFVEAARRLAENALEAKQAATHIMQYMAERTLCRPLSNEELALLAVSHQQYTAHYDSHPDDAAALIKVGDSAPAAKHSSSELAAWTMVANQLLNLDEVLNK